VALIVAILLNTATFSFAFIDQADQVGPPANYTINWASPLPVALLSFDGKSSGCDAVLTWKIGLENAISGYEIMRSEDGAVFNSIATIKATGSNSSYTVAVINKTEGIFKLKINEVNGTYSYSAALKISANCTIKEIIVLPNPAQNEVKVIGLQIGEEVVVMNMSGRKVLAAKNLINQTLNIEQLLPGIYLLQIIKEGKIIASQQLIKL